MTDTTTQSKTKVRVSIEFDLSTTDLSGFLENIQDSMKNAVWEKNPEDTFSNWRSFCIDVSNVTLSELQFDILHHTLHGAARNAYCGDSDDMQDLVKLGLMRSLGKVSWCPDEYFTITPEGRAVYTKEKLDRAIAKVSGKQ